MVIDNKIDRKRDTFELDVDIRGNVNWQEFKEVYDNIVKIDI